MILKSISWFVQHVIKTCKTVVAIFWITMETFWYLSKFQPIPEKIQKVLSGKNDFRIDYIVGRKPVIVMWSYKLNQALPSISLSLFFLLSLRLIDSAVDNVLHAYLVLTYNGLWIFYVWYYYIFCNFLWQITCYVHFIKIGHAKVKKHAVLIPNFD